MSSRSASTRPLPTPDVGARVLFALVPAQVDGGAPDERALVAGVRAGAKAAFESIFRTYYDALCAFVALYVGRVDVAEELVQDIFVWIWDRRDRWDPRDGVRTYLYGAARNQALNHARREKVETRWAAHAVVDTDDAGVGQRPAAADEAVRIADLERAVAGAIQRLPPRRREVYVLRRQHGLSQAETARAMGVSIKCVEVQFGKALETLRRDLAAFL